MTSHTNIFAHHAEDYHRMGLNIIPCGGEDGKKPLVKFGFLYKKRQTQNCIGNWIEKFPDANIGVITGRISGITIVDVDDDIPHREILREFGNTPLVARSHSGHHHYFYKYNGEKSIIGYQKRKIDILSDQKHVIFPPSVSPISNNSYSFIEGDIFDIAALSAMNPPKVLESAKKPNSPCNDPAIAKGGRNNALFDYLRSRAPYADSYQDLLEETRSYNKTQMAEPLPEKEVESVSRSVWGYKIKGCLIAPGNRYATCALEEIYLLRPIELYLLCYLRVNHSGMRETFALSADAVANTLGMSSKTVGKARNGLVKKDKIEKVHTGGKYKGDANQYRFIGG